MWGMYYYGLRYASWVMSHKAFIFVSKPRVNEIIHPKCSVIQFKRHHLKSQNYHQIHSCGADREGIYIFR